MPAVPTQQGETQPERDRAPVPNPNLRSERDDDWHTRGQEKGLLSTLGKWAAASEVQMWVPPGTAGTGS